jgi:hypothetical protein
MIIGFEHILNYKFEVFAKIIIDIDFEGLW